MKKMTRKEIQAVAENIADVYPGRKMILLMPGAKIPDELKPMHCWAASDAGTCLRASGHKGRHIYTPDKDIMLTFGEARP